MNDQTRVYIPGGTVAHLLDPWDSPNQSGTVAICGRSAWPGYWHGTGSQEEEERATDMRLCVACRAVISHRAGGVLER